MSIYNQIIFFIAPLLFAGLIHHLVIIKFNLFPLLAKPIDLGIKFKGKPILGKNKTWRGLVIFPVFSGLGALLIITALPLSLPLNPFWYGFLTGIGYALAELPNSFIKRRLGLVPGKRPDGAPGAIFFIIDQIDSVFGAILILWLIYPLSLALALNLLFIGSFLHCLVDAYLHRYGYKRSNNN